MSFLNRLIPRVVVWAIGLYYRRTHPKYADTHSAAPSTHMLIDILAALHAIHQEAVRERGALDGLGWCFSHSALELRKMEVELIIVMTEELEFRIFALVNRLLSETILSNPQLLEIATRAYDHPVKPTVEK